MSDQRRIQDFLKGGGESILGLQAEKGGGGRYLQYKPLALRQG